MKVQSILGGPRGRFVEPADDRELVRAAQQGDETAFDALVRRHAGGLHRAVARIVGDDSEAWDVVQVAFLRAWRSLGRYNPKWSFATWLYRIGTNLGIDLLRSRSSRERAHRAGSEHQLRIVGGGPSASELADRREADRVVSELAESLTPQQRAAFILREVEGRETADVAAILGCSPTTVRNHVCQARKVLRAEMERRYPEYLPAEMKRTSHEV